jgi:hypothetical protein
MGGEVGESLQRLGYRRLGRRGHWSGLEAQEAVGPYLESGEGCRPWKVCTRALSPRLLCP